MPISHTTAIEAASGRISSMPGVVAVPSQRAITNSRLNAIG